MNITDISKDFTIDDIHIIREHNYEMTKDLSFAERHCYYNAKADSFLHEYSISEEPAKFVSEETE
ncbi:MAG: hypothetical protein IKZ57_05940 [Spirochaetia bacterium]|nr:hypothetical protein [Spirochaetia bacterium]